MSSGKLGLVVNPMSGRDVRRLAARASNMTHEAKRDIVARVAAGAQAMGVTDIYITKEPFQISSLALEHMGLTARVHVVEHSLNNDASDTVKTVEAFLAAGCTTFVSLGGDGTNRAFVETVGNVGSASDVDLIPLSTGTNNVFPVLAEATVAGMVAGLNACGKIPTNGASGNDDAAEVVLKRQVKVLRVKIESGVNSGATDLGLIDAVLLRDDTTGNLLPFDADKIDQVLLTRAEPNSIGMSPLGGLIRPVYAEDNFGLLVRTQADAPGIVAPISPGLFKRVRVSGVEDIEFGQAVDFYGPGVIALDGDRDIKLREGEHATVTIERDGPWVIDIEAAMRWSVAQGIIGAEVDREALLGQA